MKSNPCINCGTSVTETSVFCHICGERLKCSSCDAVILKGAKFCSDCGTSVDKTANASNDKNTVKYHRTKDEILCEVSLSNEVGKEGIKELIQNLTNNQGASYKLEANHQKDIEEEVQDIDHSEVAGDSTLTKGNDVNNDFPHISDVEMNVNCSEVEWILIYAFYESDFSKKIFTKDSVYKRYMSKRKTSSHISNFSKNWKSLFKDYFATFNNSEIKFKTSDLTYLKNLILGKEKGTVRSISKRKVNKDDKKTETDTTSISAKSTKVKNKPSNGQSYSLLPNLNLHPKGGQSLKEYFAKFKAKNSAEIILVIVYYIEKVLKQNNIDTNTIYTCYKHIGLAVPIIDKAITNIHSRNGWINTSNRSDLKLTIAGENHIEHEMEKK